METPVLTLLFTFILIATTSLFVTSFLCFKRRWTGRGEEASLPPGKTGWPFLGETLEFVKCGHRGYPESFTLDRMKKFSTQVFKTSLMNENVAVCCGPSGNKFMFKNATIWLPKSVSKILVSEENTNVDQTKTSGKVGKLIKEVLNQEFLQNKLIDVMDSTAREQFAIYHKPFPDPQQQVLALDLAKTYTFNIACRLFLSLDDPIRVKKLLDLYRDITNGVLAIPFNFPGTAFHRALKSSLVIRKEILSIVQQRKKLVMSNGVSESLSYKDMLSRMLVLTFGQDGEFPSDMIVVEIIMALLIAGHDTASSTLSCTVKHLTEHPNVYAHVLREQMEIARDKKPGDLLNWDDIQKMKYTWCVAQETMRLTPAVQGTFREVEHDSNFAGFTIPKGWKTYWTVHSTHKNPEYFKNPEEFDPRRFEGSGPQPFTFVPFGGGIHICPGRQYAKIEILVFIHNLVTQFHIEKILANEKITYLIGATPAKGLPVRLQSRRGQIS